MRRAALLFGIVFVGLLFVLGISGCVHREQLQLDASHAERDQLAGNVSMRVDSAERAELDEHEITTSGPGERVDEDFAPAPDGGMVLAHRTVTRWGGSKSENWLKQALNATETVQLDAGVTAAHEATGELHEREDKETHPAASCAAGGMLWAIAVIGVGFVVLAILRRSRQV